MSLRFSTGKSSQTFSTTVLHAATESGDNGIDLGEAADWRTNYQRVFARLTELEAGAGGLTLQRALLEKIAELVVDDSGVSLSQLATHGLPRSDSVVSVTIQGSGEVSPLATIGSPTAEALIANHLAEPGIRALLSAYDARGTQRPTETLVAIGANAELSLATDWLAIGGTVVALARPNQAKWAALIEFARGSAGRLVVPVRAERAGELAVGAAVAEQDEQLAKVAGLDLTEDTVECAAWLRAQATRAIDRVIVLGTVYAPGAAQILAAAAQDALIGLLAKTLPADQLLVGWLATPLDSILQNPEVLAQRLARFEERKFATRLRDTTLRLLFNGPTALSPTALQDFSAQRQGSSYLLAKRIERWRAADLAARGVQTWFQVAPPANTHSTLDYKVVRAAFRGASKLGVVSFEPWMLRDLLTACLLGALETRESVGLESAIHGGVWQLPYDPHSVWLPATMLGWPELLKSGK